MKTKYSFSRTIALLLGSALFFTSCTKEALQSTISGMDAISSNSTSNSTNTLVPPNPDIGYNLIPNGVYFIQAMAHPELSLVLDVPYASSQNGALIQQYKRNNYAKNQWWYVTYLGNGYYSIINYNSYKSLDTVKTFVWIQQFTYSSSRLDQQWRIGTSVSTGISGIQNRLTGMALDVPSGSPNPQQLIQQYTPNNQSNQAWKFLLWCPDLSCTL